MKLENTFTVPVPAAQAWQVLLDVERIAPCLPGASVTGRDGEKITGQVKVKVGPISMIYRGTATFASLDEDSHVAVIEAAGKESRGSGTAKATITARLRENGGRTEVSVDTDLTVTGKPAQFGRGVLVEVSEKLVGQFASCLAEEISSGGSATHGSEPAGTAPAGTEPGVDGTGPQPAAVARPAPESLDLLATAGLPVLKWLAAPVAAALALLALLVWRRRG